MVASSFRGSARFATVSHIEFGPTSSLELLLAGGYMFMGKIGLRRHELNSLFVGRNPSRLSGTNIRNGRP